MLSSKQLSKAIVWTASPFTSTFNMAEILGHENSNHILNTETDRPDPSHGLLLRGDELA